MHNLEDVTATSLVYSTNRRNDVDMDVVVRDLATGEERVVFDEGGYVAETVVSHDGRSTAVNRLGLLPQLDGGLRRGRRRARPSPIPRTAPTTRTSPGALTTTRS